MSKRYLFVDSSTCINDIKTNINETTGVHLLTGKNSTNKFLELEKWINFRNYSTLFDCASLVQGNSTLLKKTKEISNMYPRKPIEDNHFIMLTQNCDQFKRSRGYITKFNLTNETAFPIAYSILFYKELEQVEYLLRAIYRPQNVYCLHLDKFYSKVIDFSN